MQQENTLATAAENAAKPWGSYSVLVVDDEPGMVNFIRRALEVRCGSVHTAGSVEDAEPLVAQQRFDLIVLEFPCPACRG